MKKICIILLSILIACTFLFGAYKLLQSFVLLNLKVFSKRKKYACNTVTPCMMDDYKKYRYPRDHESSETVS